MFGKLFTNSISPFKFESYPKQAVRPVVGPCKWRLEQPSRSFSLPVTAHVYDAAHCTPFIYQDWNSYDFPFRTYDWFSVTALIGLVTLTFDLSTSKRGHESPVSWASFPPIFSLLYPSVLDLGSGTWQTDRRRPSVLHPMRAGA